MHFNEYQKRAASTARYPEGVAEGLPPGMYTALGLNGEAGEVAEKIKKLWRDGMGALTRDDVRDAIRKELGDVLWYLSETARQWDIELEDIAHTNLSKLASRALRGVLHGSGDER